MPVYAHLQAILRNMPGHSAQERSEYEMRYYMSHHHSHHQGVVEIVPDIQESQHMYGNAALPHTSTQIYHSQLLTGGHVNVSPPFYEPHSYHSRRVSSNINQGLEMTRMINGSKMKRKRVINSDQRKAANIRERRRMLSLNDSFDELRKAVPTFSYEKKLSRIETLRLSLVYIAFLSDILEGKDPQNVKLLQLCPRVNLGSPGKRRAL